MLFTTCIKAQDYKRASIWYFGDSAGISFSSNPPIALLNSAMKAVEGCATMCDTNGNLLFYTNGITVWNKNHQVMHNGDSIKGHLSATQGALIVPQPNNDSIFYLFTTPYAYDLSNGLRYSVIDISKNSGLGSIIKKNLLLQTSVTEKIGATFHANGTDFWIITHGYGNNYFYAYLLTQDGLLNCPVMSAIGTGYNFDPFISQGQLKISSNGKRVASTLYTTYYKVELFDFDNSIGFLSNSININTTDLSSNPYGVEFSPNNKRLYVAERGRYLKQFDLVSNNATQINNSAFILDSFPSSFSAPLQIGTDKRIYLTFKNDSSYLNAILFPDSLGASCGYVRKYVPLANRKPAYGLPSIVSSYLAIDTLINFNYQFICPSNFATFKAKNHSSLPQWTITKLSSAGSWVYNGTTATHNFDSGTYTVKLKAGADSIIKTITVGWSGELLLASDTNRCQTDSVFLTIRNSQSFSCIKWNDTISSNSITAKTNGTYRVSAWNMQGCKLSDSIHVRLFATPPDPLVKPMPDTIIFCKGNSIALIPDSGANFQWQDGYPFASRIVDTTGLFYTSWTDSFTCQRGDTTRLIFYPTTPLQNPLPDSVTFCIGKTMTLLPDSGTNFHWQDNYPNATRTIDSAGLFYTNWFDTNGCRISDSILVKTYSVTKPTIQRLGDSLFTSGSFSQWQWYYTGQPVNGATFTKYKATQNGWYKVLGRDVNQCIATSDSVNLTNVFVYNPTFENEITVFPNPVNRVLHIRLQKAAGQLTGLQLYSSTGQLVYRETSPNHSEAEIDCSAMPKGLYLLSLIIANKAYFQKIIIHN